jgi:hypothetical protein
VRRMPHERITGTAGRQTRKAVPLTSSPRPSFPVTRPVAAEADRWAWAERLPGVGEAVSQARAVRRAVVAALARPRARAARGRARRARRAASPAAPAPSIRPVARARGHGRRHRRGRRASAHAGRGERTRCGRRRARVIVQTGPRCQPPPARAGFAGEEVAAVGGKDGLPPRTRMPAWPGRRDVVS